MKSKETFMHFYGFEVENQTSVISNLIVQRLYKI